MPARRRAAAAIRGFAGFGADAYLLAMKLATFNINNINRRIGNLLAWLVGGAA